ncbi:MAG: peptidase, partial [Clostridia bacterium]|nr:peptidase [Clostridia bacterium]
MFTLLEASSGIVWLVVGIILAVVAVIILISTIKIVPQARASVVEFLGSYKTTWHTGVHFKIPILEKVRNEISLMEQVSDFPPQPVITKDNVRMQIDTVVFYQITDCKLYTYGVENPLLAIESLTSTTLRNIIG